MEPFKNFINKNNIKELSKCLVSSDFNQKKFFKLAVKDLESLELKERVNQVADAINMSFDSDYKQTTKILVNSLKHDEVKSFIVWPLTTYVEKYGINHFVTSHIALKALTKKFTSEFAIRPFIQKYPQKSYALLLRWAKDKNEHVRRLASEGSRPLLPWGMKISFIDNDIEKNIAILSLLKFDNSEYVRKSVANHINDLSKTNATQVIKTLKNWKREVPDSMLKEFNWLVNHSLRTLIKAGDKNALTFLGYSPNIKLDFDIISLPKKAKIGQKTTFCFKVTNKSKKTRKIILDYGIHLLRKNNQHNLKMFKFKKLELKAGETSELQLNHSFKLVTTRKYYPGAHQIEFFANGNSLQTFDFILTNKT